ncbi:Fc.00g012100.m01.CDS01 [Cosmosporella sp. VM-42]
MKSLWSLLLLCLVAVQEAEGQTSSVSDSIASLPVCAIKCLAVAVTNSPCSATNQTCLCTTESLQADVTVCVTKSCTVKEALFTKNVTETNCGAPIRNKSDQYESLSNSLGIISGIFVVQRLGFKIWANLDLGLDDWFTLITILAGVPSSILTVHGTLANGLGRDIWTLTAIKITNFGMYFYIMAILYFAQVTLLKLALLFFYLRIFPATPIRRLLWGTVVFNCVFGAVFCVVAAFQCRPVSYFWTKWDGEHEGSCVNVNAVGWSNAAISIALDVWMLAIPMSQLKDLNLDWRKKIGVGMMFCVGAFVTVVSILRLRSLVTFESHSINPTWEYLEVSKWSTIEINVGIICTCMPTLRLVLVRIFPKLLGTTQRYYANYASNKASRQQQSRSRPMGTSAISHVDMDRSHNRTESKGITCHTTYAVEYDNDETQLVHMRELDTKSSKSDASV